MAVQKKRIGEMLLEAGIIDETQLKAALGHQRQWGVRLGQALVDLKLATEADIVRALSLKFGFEVAKIDTLEPYAHEQALKLFPREFAIRNNVFPMWADTANVTVAMSDPSNLAVVDEVRFRTGRRVKVCIGGDREIAEAVKRAFHAEGAVEAIALDLDPDAEAPGVGGEAVFDPFGGGSRDALEAFFGGGPEPAPAGDAAAASPPAPAPPVAAAPAQASSPGSPQAAAPSPRPAGAPGPAQPAPAPSAAPPAAQAVLPPRPGGAPMAAPAAASVAPAAPGQGSPAPAPARPGPAPGRPAAGLPAQAGPAVPQRATPTPPTAARPGPAPGPAPGPQGAPAPTTAPAGAVQRPVPGVPQLQRQAPPQGIPRPAPAPGPTRAGILPAPSQPPRPGAAPVPAPAPAPAPAQPAAPAPAGPVAQPFAAPAAPAPAPAPAQPLAAPAAPRAPAPAPFAAPTAVAAARGPAAPAAPTSTLAELELEEKTGDREILGELTPLEETTGEIAFAAAIPAAAPAPVETLTPREVAILDSIDRLASGLPAQPDVVKPTQAMAALIRLLVRKRLVTEREFLDELNRK